MQPWETLVLLVSKVVCRCDSSNFSLDVECGVISTSAHPLTMHVSFTTYCFPHYMINKTTYSQISE